MSEEEKLKFLIQLGITSLSILTVALTFIIDKGVIEASSNAKIFTFYTLIAGIVLFAGLKLSEEIGDSGFDILTFTMIVGIIGGINYFVAQIMKNVGTYSKYSFNLLGSDEIGLTVYQFVFALIILLVTKLILWITEKISENPLSKYFSF